MIRLGPYALGAMTVFMSCVAHAQSSVVIVVPYPGTPEYHAFEHRLRSELVAEGFQPVSIEVPVEVTRQVLKTSANRFMSNAAISIAIHDGVVSGLVWIQARTGSEDTWRSVPDYPLSEQAPTVFAVKATDVLHGGLLELGYIGTQPEAPPPPTPPSSPPADQAPPSPIQLESPKAPITRPKTRRKTKRAPPKNSSVARRNSKSKPAKAPKGWQLSATGSLAVHFLSYPTDLGMSLSAAHRLYKNWALGVTGAYFAPSGFRGEHSGGQASVSRAKVGGRLEFFQPLSRRLSLYELFEAGLHATLVSSSVPPPYTAHSARSLSGYNQLGVGVSWGTSSTLALAFASSLMLPWKRADVQSLQTVVAEAAGPTIVIDTGVQLCF